MPSNFPGPYEIEIKYTVSGIQHVQRLNCQASPAPSVGDAPFGITLIGRDLSAVNLETWVNNWVTQIDGFFHTSVTFDSYDLYQYAVGTFERVWITSGTIGVNGTSPTATQLARQDTFTFRTVEGNTMRVVLLETVFTQLTRTPYPAIVPGVSAMMDIITATATPVLARDTSYPIAPLNHTGGQNEATFKARYR
ncbi:MAG: hypothetical protein [Circular genetic element sp.]|nr:MAG: hypothetical protein [Circular genetic element sp.]